MTATNQTVLKPIVQTLKSKFNENLVSIILFGSHARAQSKKYSDIDLLVILDELNQSQLEKNELEFELSWEWQEKYNKKIDLILMSREDALANFKVHSPLFSTLVLGVKIYYDKQQFFLKSYTSFLDEMKQQKYYYTDSNATWDLSQKATDLLNSPENSSEWLSTT